MLGLCYVLDSSLQVLEADSMGYKSVVVIRDALSGKRQEPRPNFDNHMRWGKFFLKYSTKYHIPHFTKTLCIVCLPSRYLI